PVGRLHRFPLRPARDDAGGAISWRFRTEPSLLFIIRGRRIGEVLLLFGVGRGRGRGGEPSELSRGRGPRQRGFSSTSGSKGPASKVGRRFPLGSWPSPATKALSALRHRPDERLDDDVANSVEDPA